MSKKIFFLIFIGTVGFFSCKKEKTRWDSDWAAPIAHGHLTINDMIPIKYTETNADGYLSLVIHEPVFGFSLDTLIKLPDTTIVQKTAIGLPTVDVGPGFELPDSYNQGYELGDIQLKRVIVKSGKAITAVESSWPGKTKVTFTFPHVNGPEGVFQRIYYLDAGSVTSPAVANDLIDMAMYDMDLRGVDGNSYNTIGINVLVESNEAVDNFTVTNTDSIAFSFSFKDMVPLYAKGYFGQYYFADTTALALPPMKKIVAGAIDLDSISLTLTVKNGFNIIGRAKISQITGVNSRTGNAVDLDFAEKNTTLNIDPADGGLYDYVPSEYPIQLNNVNCNIIDFIENLSDSIQVGYALEINPFGNVTAGSDEFFPNSKMELFVDGEFPLHFGANDLTIQDTLEINWIDTQSLTPQEANVLLEYTNGFPLGANAKFYLLDETNAVIDSISVNSTIQAGVYADPYTTTPTNGQLQFSLSSSQFANLENTKKMILSVSFNSYGDDKVKISPDSFFDFKIRTNLKISVSV